MITPEKRSTDLRDRGTQKRWSAGLRMASLARLATRDHHSRVYTTCHHDKNRNDQKVRSGTTGASWVLARPAVEIPRFWINEAQYTRNHGWHGVQTLPDAVDEGL